MRYMLDMLYLVWQLSFRSYGFREKQGVNSRKKLFWKYCICIKLPWVVTIFHFAKSLPQLVSRRGKIPSFQCIYCSKVTYEVIFNYGWTIPDVTKKFLYTQSNIVSQNLKSYVVDIYIQIWSNVRKKYILGQKNWSSV